LQIFNYIHARLVFAGCFLSDIRAVSAMNSECGERPVNYHSTNRRNN